MNDTTEQNINQAIDWLQQTGGQIQDFATTQAPLYCQEVVAFTFWSGFIFCLFGVIALLVAVFFANKLFSWIKKGGEVESSTFVISLFTSFISVVIGISLLGDNLTETIKAKVAPRMIIVEHLKNLTK